MIDWRCILKNYTFSAIQFLISNIFFNSVYWYWISVAKIAYREEEKKKSLLLLYCNVISDQRQNPIFQKLCVYVCSRSLKSFVFDLFSTFVVVVAVIFFFFSHFNCFVLFHWFSFLMCRSYVSHTKTIVHYYCILQYRYCHIVCLTCIDICIYISF